MYYFETARWKLPLFWKENGLPIFLNGQRISRRRLVWWMPTNWFAIIIMLILAPFAKLKRKTDDSRAKSPVSGDAGPAYESEIINPASPVPASEKPNW